MAAAMRWRLSLTESMESLARAMLLTICPSPGCGPTLEWNLFVFIRGSDGGRRFWQRGLSGESRFFGLLGVVRNKVGHASDCLTGTCALFELDVFDSGCESPVERGRGLEVELSRHEFFKAQSAHEGRQKPNHKALAVFHGTFVRVSFEGPLP